MLKAKNLSKKYGNLTVLINVSIEILRSEFVCLLGSSGAGKSTLLHLLGTLDSADDGEIYFENEKINEWKETRKSKFRNEQLGFVFQFHHLLEEFTALENVAIPAMIKGISQKQAFQMAENLLERVGLKERMKHFPSQLSGGEQQRVAVSRALINQPVLILADEPTGNLDQQNTESLFTLFKELNRDFQTAFLIATHNLRLREISDRTIFIRSGAVIDENS